MIITKKDLEYLFKDRSQKEAFLRVDFGQKFLPVKIEKKGIMVKGGYFIDFNTKLKDNFCYLLRKRKGLLPVAFFSDDTNKFYKLLPSKDWPSVTVGSVSMHRLKIVSPKEDTERKIRLIKPYGVVLDTCMGLGYTAILSSYTAKRVYTFEIDRNIYFIAKINPLSKKLFERDNIVIKIGDIYKLVTRFKDDFFDCIIHDPPTFKLAPLLYSEGFYNQLKRVLKRKGRLFHYLPFYGIKRGRDFPQEIREKLKDVGFKIIVVSYEDGGIVCQK